MCFFIEKKNKEVKIAKKDIVCYKALIRNHYGDIISPFRRAEYFSYSTQKRIKRIEVGKMKKILVDLVDLELYFLPELFTKAESTSEIITNGLHTYSSLRLVKMRAKGFGWQVYKAIIPKDTEYYYNSRTKEYVSTKLKVYKKEIV